MSQICEIPTNIYWCHDIRQSLQSRRMVQSIIVWYALRFFVYFIYHCLYVMKYSQKCTWETEGTTYVQKSAQCMCKEKLEISASHLWDTQTHHSPSEIERQKFHPHHFTYAEQQRKKVSHWPSGRILIKKNKNKNKKNKLIALHWFKLIKNNWIIKCVEN